MSFILFFLFNLVQNHMKVRPIADIIFHKKFNFKLHFTLNRADYRLDMVRVIEVN